MNDQIFIILHFFFPRGDPGYLYGNKKQAGIGLSRDAMQELIRTFTPKIQ